MSFFRTTFASVFLILGLASTAFAQSGGVVQEFVGDVVVLSGKDGKSVKVTAKKQKFNFGETIQTAKGAKAQLVLGNGEVILLKEESIFKLDGKKGAVKGIISQGEYLIGITKKLGKSESFLIETPACVAGVRGTLFWGLSDKDKNSTYAALENQIEVSAQGNSVILKPGEKVFVPFGKAPEKSAPANIPLDYLDTFGVNGQIQGLKGMLK